jgi:hypothetical protein
MGDLMGVAHEDQLLSQIVQSPQLCIHGSSVPPPGIISQI